MSSLSRELVFLLLQFLEEEEKFKESVHMENEQLSKYGDTKTARNTMIVELKKMIEANPLFRDKLVFPTLRSTSWCTAPNGNVAPTPVTLPVAAVAKPAAYTQPFHPTPAAAVASANALAGLMGNAAASSSVQAAVVTASSIPVPPNQVPIRKRPRTLLTTLGMVDYQNPDHELLMKRLRPAQSVEEVTYPTPRQ